MREIAVPAVPSIRWRRFERPIRHGLTLAGVFVLVAFVLPNEAIDLHTYWSVHPATPYATTSSVEAWNAFPYSPVVALLLGPMHAIGFEAARILLIGADLAVLWWLVGPWALGFVALMPVFQEIAAGNVQLLITASIVAGMRWPAAWSFVLLTKVTPGIGLVWFVVRREWRSLAMALGTTAALGAVSWLIHPGWWSGWFAMLTRNVGTQEYWTLFGIAVWIPPVLLRFPLAAGLVAWGARTDRPWTVVVAAMLALPAIWTTSVSMLVGCLPLVARAERQRA